MTDTPAPPTIRAPRGFEIAEVNGELVARRVARTIPNDRVISFRTSAETYAEVLQFVEAFPEREFGVAMRWLLDQEPVRTLMREVMREATRPQHTP